MADINKQVQIELIAKDSTKAAFESAARNAEQARMSFGQLVGGVAVGQAVFSAASAAILAAGRAVKNFTKESVETALEMERVNKVLPIVAKNTGKTEDEINSLIYAIREEGKSMLEAKNITLELSRAQLGEAEALQLISAARDLAATAGVSSSTANQAILQSVNQLTPSYLQQLGIQVSLRVAYEEFAETLGKTAGELTTAEKKQAIFNATIKEAEKVAGAYDAAMGSSAKLLKSLSDAFETVKLAIGEMLTGAAYPLIEATYGSIKAFNNWAYTTDNELNPSLKAVQSFIAGTMIGTFEMLKAGTNAIRESYVRLVEWLGRLGVLQAFQNAWERIVEVYTARLKPAIDDLMIALEPYKPLLAEIARLAGTIVVGALVILLETITQLIVFTTEAATVATRLATGLANALAPAISFVDSAISALVKTIEWLIGKFNSAVVAAQSAASAIRGAFASASSAASGAENASATTGSYYRDKVPKLATGGIVTRPTLALIGESGPEAVVPLNGRAGIGEINILQGATVNVSNEADEDRLIRKISAELARATQTQRFGMATAY